MENKIELVINIEPLIGRTKTLSAMIQKMISYREEIKIKNNKDKRSKGKQ